MTNFGARFDTGPGQAYLDGRYYRQLAALPAGSLVVVEKDLTTGFWPVSYDATTGLPVYTAGANNAGTRPTSRTDLRVAWKGADPSPAIVSSGTGGMLDNADVRWVTP